MHPELEPAPAPRPPRGPTLDEPRPESRMAPLHAPPRVARGHGGRAPTPRPPALPAPPARPAPLAASAREPLPPQKRSASIPSTRSFSQRAAAAPLMNPGPAARRACARGRSRPPWRPSSRPCGRMDAAAAPSQVRARGQGAARVRPAPAPWPRSPVSLDCPWQALRGPLNPLPFGPQPPRCIPVPEILPPLPAAGPAHSRPRRALARLRRRPGAARPLVRAASGHGNS
jgi:hypothetical protein